MKNFPIVSCKNNNHIDWQNFDCDVQFYCKAKNKKASKKY